ncbi:MAG TPA: Hsp20/alpha crystallin family protein [Phycisphaerae bacterium]|nr:Hsp20/alpha crystallin family protein [Phycisphaerae bacterium]
MIIQTHAVEDSFDSMNRQIHNLINEMGRRNYYRFSRSAAWEPAVDILEDQQNLYLCVELAGLPEEAIVVEVADRKLIVRGERPAPKPPASASPECIVHMEINSGPFERIIDLPDRADPGRIEAKLESGFLWITIVKKPT